MKRAFSRLSTIVSQYDKYPGGIFAEYTDRSSIIGDSWLAENRPCKTEGFTTNLKEGRGAMPNNPPEYVLAKYSRRGLELCI
jgi:hypothetical protein